MCLLVSIIEKSKYSSNLQPLTYEKQYSFYKVSKNMYLLCINFVSTKIML